MHAKRWSLLRSMLSIIAEYPDSHEHVGSHTCVHTPFGQLVILHTKRGLHGHHELWRVGVHVVDGPKVVAGGRACCRWPQVLMVASSGSLDASGQKAQLRSWME